MTRIDLHTHSTHSDGTFGPAELVRLAAERDLDVVALTDHDTTDGLPEALATGLEVGVEVVPGVEFSAEYLGTSVHILCYWMRAEDPALQLELGRLRDDRYRRGELMVEKLRALGLPVAFERVREIAGEATIVR
ncbi:MAG TPA: PHP domain-containing protein, partial [Actinomycetota bacterium]|nr:PHP domain-containing protein [Actinomycetota bacterium]